MSRSSRRQERYDKMKAAQTKADERRLDLEAMHRGMAGHPASETKRRSFHEMKDHELKAHGMIRIRTLFGTKIISRTSHQARMMEKQEAAKVRKEATKQAVKAAAKRAAKNALKKR